jgi:hypothetical protein
MYVDSFILPKPTVPLSIRCHHQSPSSQLQSYSLYTTATALQLQFTTTAQYLSLFQMNRRLSCLNNCTRLILHLLLQFVSLHYFELRLRTLTKSVIYKTRKDCIGCSLPSWVNFGALNTTLSAGLASQQVPAQYDRSDTYIPLQILNPNLFHPN